MTSSEQSRYEGIEAFIAEFPYPLKGSTFVSALRLYGVDGFRYFDDRFPFVIFYEVDEHEIHVHLIMKSATKRTPI